jgi:hypothetical protein
MSVALTTTYENGIFGGVSDPFLRQWLALTKSPDCTTRVGVIDWLARQGYNVCVMVPFER